jgi:methionyl aminopeptidase
MMPSTEQGIIIKSPQEIAVMRDAGKILAEILTVLEQKAAAGMTTADLDSMAAKEMAARGVTPSFLGYRGYPARICVSVNDEIVHGIPGPRVLKAGDIVGIDCGIIFQGFQSDSAMTIGIGEITPEAARLIDVTRESLEQGIKAATAGARVTDIGAAVQAYAERAGYSVVREYVGHGIGHAMHEEPQVPNFGPAGKGALLRPGMALAIEPMVNIGGWETRVGPDRWTVFTKDGSLSAHFEHTIAITDHNPEVLTRRDGTEVRK